MGTPEFAVPSLDRLAEAHEVVDVLTQPDRPAGRGRALTAPPVKLAAERHGLRVFQPERVGADDSFARLAADAPDVIAIVGYGQFIPKRIRELAAHRCVNVHSSLLPKYRGAAPVNWALVRGEARTGVTTMRIAKEVDAGDILMARETAVGPDETASELNRRLAPIGAQLLLETLAGLERGELHATPQDHSAATVAPRIRREDGLIDWSLPARSIYNRLRGFDPWPGIYTFLRGKRLRIVRARAEPAGGIEPGRLRQADDAVAVGCGSGRLVLDEVRLEGRATVAALDFARGASLAPDEELGND